MTSVVAKDTYFAKEFRERFGDANDAIGKCRQEAIEYFTETGLPTLRQEDWKYTNIAPIANVDWRVGKQTSEDVGNVLELVREFNFERNGFTALNQAFAAYRVIRIPKETSVETPFIIEHAAADGEAIFPHTIIVAEAGSRATVVEVFASEAAGFTNSATQIFVEDNASLTHYRVQKDAADAFNYGVTEVTVGRAARYDATSINLGGAITRHDIEVDLTAEGGETAVDGLYMLSGSQHHDTHSIIDHKVPNCTSHQSYKGVLNDTSRGVFNGKVFVREGAHGTDAQQSNKNLLLSNDARVDTKPQLEIFNEDVKCAHGATVGQLEEEELFYLLTRGLPESLARNLLTYGFAEEIINKITIPEIKAELDAAVLNRLDAKI
ncbi:MAG: Fe-S cluster assembly protein SufD [Acidobacteria bacterium]|nr:Fe-S cluster assembly protein SufD [Acidobacteriota bacterium]